MKKIVSLLCILALLSCGGIVTVAAMVNQNKDTVTITEEVQYGDATLANGFVVDMKVQYDDHLLWKTNYEKAEGTKTDTEFSFNAEELVYAWEYRNDPVAMNVSFEAAIDLEAPVESLSGLAKAYRQIFEQTQPGQEARWNVYVKNYYEYYPFFIQLELPGNSIWMNEKWLDNVDGFNQGEHEVYKAFSEFFRIPVGEKDCIEVVVDRDQSNGMMSQSVSSEHLQLYSESET